MKKIFVAFCAVMIFAVVSCVALNSEDTGETHIHNHAYAAASFWRRRQCGMQATDHGSPPSEFGCDVSRNR